MLSLVELLVGLLVGKSYHTIENGNNSWPTNSPTNNHISWIRMRKKIGL